MLKQVCVTFLLPPGIKGLIPCLDYAVMLVHVAISDIKNSDREVVIDGKFISE